MPGTINPRYLTYTKNEVQALLDEVNNLRALLSLPALMAYAVCSTGASTAAKAVAITGYSLPTNGGCLHIKMTHANTVASNVKLNINTTGAKPLYYNGSAVSASNTWEDNEIIEVYYDGNNYQASNARGGGGRADKISFDPTVKKKYSSTQVQGVIDEITDAVTSNANAITTLNSTTLPTLQSNLQGDIDATISVYNVTKNHPLQSGSYDISSASNAVPSAKRRIGLIITYQISASAWETKQFIGSNPTSGWTTAANWSNFGDGDFVAVTSEEVAAMDDPT